MPWSGNQLCVRCNKRAARHAGKLCTPCRDGAKGEGREPEPEPEPTPAEKRAERDTVAALRSEVRGLEAELRDATARAEFVEAMREKTTVRGASIVAREHGHGAREGVAVGVFSDFHVGEVVESERVAGLNSYNLSIARERATRAFDGFSWLTKNMGGMFHVHEAVVALLGDLITGYIHEELMEGAECSPIHAVRYAYGLIRTGLEHILAELPDLERLTVLCIHGNHGRTTAKPRIATGSDNSFEHLLYLFLADAFEGNERVRFVVARGEHLYFPIYGHDTRWMHGDGVKYNNGVGGVMVALNRAIFKLDRARPCAFSVLAHHHQFHPGRATVNGSLIGYTPFAQKLNFEFERPSQTFFMVDATRGMCLETPIWVDGETERRLWV